MNEIQAIIRQITASVTFLPLLQDACTFDLLVYTDNDVSVPQAWEESEPKYINNQQEVRCCAFFDSFPVHTRALVPLRHFHHRVDTYVSTCVLGTPVSCCHLPRYVP
jgi:hypothetical protein